MSTTDNRFVRSAMAFVADHASDSHEANGVLEAIADNGAANLYLCPDREAWLALRAAKRTIGASDAPAIEGLTDGWKTARQLFDELTGEAEHGDIEGNELIDMGIAEEPLSRQLFALENPRYTIYDGSNLLWVSRTKPWMSCTLDAILVDSETQQWSDLEIKCAPWSNKWRSDFMPDNYFVQVLWQLSVTGMRRAFLKARLRWEEEYMRTMSRAVEKNYYIDSAMPEVKRQMAALEEHGEKFFRMVEEGRYFPQFVRI